MTTDNAVAAPEKASRWEDFIDILFSPGELYDRRAAESWLTPFLILCAVSMALYYLLMPVTAPLLEAALRENAPPEATQAQAQQMFDVMRWAGGILVPFGYAFMIAVAAVGIKLVSALLEPGASWRQAFVIPTYASFVMVPQAIITALLVFVKNQTGAELTGADASFGVLRLTGTDVDPVVRALLSRIDLFVFWICALIAVGLMHVVRMPRNKAIITAAAVWVIGTLPALVGALMASRS